MTQMRDQGVVIMVMGPRLLKGGGGNLLSVWRNISCWAVLKLSVDCSTYMRISEIKSILLFVFCGGIICLSHISQPFDASKRLLHWVTECSTYELDTFSLRWWQVPLRLTKRNKNKFLVWIILNGALCCKINNISDVNRSYGIRRGVQITHNNLSVRNSFIPHCEVRRQAQSSPLKFYWIIN